MDLNCILPSDSKSSRHSDLIHTVMSRDPETQIRRILGPYLAICSHSDESTWSYLTCDPIKNFIPSHLSRMSLTRNSDIYNRHKHNKMDGNYTVTLDLGNRTGIRNR